MKFELAKSVHEISVFVHSANEAKCDQTKQLLPPH
jgi:hypothetical protein